MIHTICFVAYTIRPLLALTPSERNVTGLIIGGILVGVAVIGIFFFCFR